MVLYHGTNLVSSESILKEGIQLSKGRREADFGIGFYATQDLEFAKRCAYRKSFRSRPVVLKIEFDYDKAKDAIKSYYSPNLEWAQFIVNNRNGLEYANAMPVGKREHNIDGKYDIVYGKIADIDVVGVAERLKTKGMPISNFLLRKLINDEYPSQYSFHSKKSLEYIQKVWRV